jgi:hypothetical protein
VLGRARSRGRRGTRDSAERRRGRGTPGTSLRLGRHWGARSQWLCGGDDGAGGGVAGARLSAGAFLCGVLGAGAFPRDCGI